MLLNVRVKHTCLDFSGAFDLDENAIVAGLRETIRKTDFRRKHSGVWHRHGHRQGFLRRSGTIRQPILCEFQSGHGDGTCRMHVCKNAQIGADKFCMSGHAHVRFQIPHWMAASILYGKCEVQRHTRFQESRRTLPNNLAAVRKWGDRGIGMCRGNQRRAGPHRIVTGKRRSADDLWKINTPDEGPRKTTRVDNVGEHLIMAGGHVRQIYREPFSVCRIRMKVPHGIQFRGVKQKQMHQVAMIGDGVAQSKIGGGSRIRAIPPSVFALDANRQAASVNQLEGRRRRLEKIYPALKISRIQSPPGVAKKKQDGDKCRGAYHCPARAAFAGIARDFAALQIAFTHDSADDEDHANGQNQHEGEQKRSERFRHR